MFGKLFGKNSETLVAPTSGAHESVKIYVPKIPKDMAERVSCFVCPTLRPLGG